MSRYHSVATLDLIQSSQVRRLCEQRASDRRRAVQDELARLIGRELTHFLEGDNSTLHVKGLPFDLDPDRVGTPLADTLALAIASVIGEPYGYTAECPTVLQDVRPMQANAQASTSSGATEPLGFHTDLDYFPDRPRGPYDVTNPDAIVLVAVRPDRCRLAHTMYVDVRDIADGLSERAFGQLMSPTFTLPSSYSFTRLPADQRPWSDPTSVVKANGDELVIAADLLPGRPTSMDGSALSQGALDERSGRALDELREFLNDTRSAVQVTLGSGEALVLNNRRGLHARTAFEATYDQHDRWLKRVYVRKDVSALRSVDSKLVVRLTA